MCHARSDAWTQIPCKVQCQTHAPTSMCTHAPTNVCRHCRAEALATCTDTATWRHRLHARMCYMPWLHAQTLPRRGTGYMHICAICCDLVHRDSRAETLAACTHVIYAATWYAQKPFTSTDVKQNTAAPRHWLHDSCCDML